MLRSLLLPIGVVSLASAAQAQLTLAASFGAPWKLATQHVASGTITPVPTTLVVGDICCAADEASGVMYFVVQNTLHAWPYGAAAPTQIGPIPGGTSNFDLAFAAGKLYMTRLLGLTQNTIVEIDPLTGAGAVWLAPTNISPTGIAFDAANNRLIVSSQYVCNSAFCLDPSGLYAIDLASQAITPFAPLPPTPPVGSSVNSTSLSFGGGEVWSWGRGASLLARLDLSTMTWSTSPSAVNSIFIPALEWSPGFDSGCAGVVYCTAGTSSNGCVPSICASGVASASSPTGFTISVSALDGQRSGLLMYGVNGPIASPWAAGSTSFRCVATPVQRMGAQNSGGTFGVCNGVMSEDWNAYVSSNVGALGQPFSGGETAWAQGWYRDPAAPKSSGLTNGIEFQVTP